MSDDFGFLHGTWSVHNRRLKRRLVGSTEWEEFTGTSTVIPVFGGAGNVDEIDFGGDRGRGLTLRLYDTEAGTWSLHWAHDAGGRLFPPIVGTFTGGVGTFYGDDVEGGTPVTVRFVWSGIGPATARWEQSFSADGGETWELNWIMEFTRL
ncbi:hypothetical protein [Plantactinospora sp. KBS50]|uniref:hypothetical protein n=1 Tax=Plantactinospora sp. KBS50 TaxID=2024580 RepID=UPI000BAAF653|nr:hypothetical protein [Plantactinospora sp. KBS50]ASW54879.1 hypothetical protein CIK06_12815 [Plantactinospora sp. KBS50]